ncbi:MAG TPA: hypothetical protein VI816_01320, partial [Candidatus Bathyarchaeia archaeon]|nr:hypothetical protein [Candidatus Bathyarchaeia archaeon]
RHQSNEQDRFPLYRIWDALLYRTARFFCCSSLACMRLFIPFPLHSTLEAGKPVRPRCFPFVPNTLRTAAMIPATLLTFSNQLIRQAITLHLWEIVGLDLRIMFLPA